MDGLVWPARTWPLSELSEEQYSNWTRDGYLIVPDAVTHDLATAAAAAIREYIGANESEPPTWYRNTRDIYTERNDDGTMPHHGPAGIFIAAQTQDSKTVACRKPLRVAHLLCVRVPFRVGRHDRGPQPPRFAVAEVCGLRAFCYSTASFQACTLHFVHGPSEHV